MQLSCALLWILVSVKILVSIGLSSAQCGVFIIVDVFIPMFGGEKKFNQV